MSDPSGSGLIVHSRQPFNAETPPARLRAAFVTPQRDFYIRCHGDIPHPDGATHRLRIGGLVGRPLDLSMEDLKAGFPGRTVTAVLQCAGNRRGDLRQICPVAGDPWGAGAIGQAEWTGVPLGDLLRAADVREAAGLHAAFSCLDECEAEGERFRYGVSIPLAKAMSPEVLLAWAMNGEPLASEHGFPLRVLVPGHAGVRSAKWLAGITVQDHPSEARPQARDYKLFPPDVRKETAVWEAGMTIGEMPLNSAICEPAPQSVLKPGAVVLRGWAHAGPRGIARVDLSADGGRHWRQAHLEQDGGSLWGWCFWELVMELPPGEHELVVRAWDHAGQTQPALPDETWNWKGYLNNSWHRLRVRAE